MPQQVEDCVKALMKDPDFKPKNPKQGKRSAAYAVCTAQYQKQQQKKSIPMRITKATIRDGGMYWEGAISDDDWDKEDERLSLEIFDDFGERLKAQQQKADYQPPFISLSHYSRMQDGSGVMGTIEDVWTEDRVFKAKGPFEDTRLGRRVFEVVKDELERMAAGEEIENPVRFSVGFFPHQIMWED